MKSDLNSLYLESLNAKAERTACEDAVFEDWLSISPEHSSAFEESCVKVAESMKAKREAGLERELENARTAAEGEVLKQHAHDRPGKYKEKIKSMLK